MKNYECKLEDEIWKQHSIGVWVSNKGKVNTKRKGVNFGYNNSEGYKQIKWQGKMYKVHRLIAECFIPNPNNLPTVDHINRDKGDNRVENLRWADYSTQMLNREVDFKARTAKTDYKAIAKKLSIPVQQFDMQENFVREWKSAHQVERELGYNRGNINSCCKGRYKSSNGFIWKYAS